MVCKKCAEEVCGCETKEADTQTFEAMRRLAPSSRDVDTARRYLKNAGFGEVIYDRYLVNRAGSSNKYYYTSITKKDGKYYPMGAYGRIGALSALFNIKGKKVNPKASCSSMEEAYRYVKEKERTKIRKPGEKAYIDYTLQMAETFEAVIPGGAMPFLPDLEYEDFGGYMKPVGTIDLQGQVGGSGSGAGGNGEEGNGENGGDNGEVRDDSAPGRGGGGDISSAESFNAEGDMTAMQVVIGASHGSTMDWSRIFNVNVRGSTEDLGYLTAGLEDEVKDRVSKWNKTWDAESFNADEPSPTFDEGITGQDGPSAEPTNARMKADSLAEIEGPTEEATSGGLHSPSSFTTTWEDGTGYSSASIPPNEIAWAEGKDENVVVKAVKTPIGAVFVGTAIALLGYSVITGGNLLKDLSAGAKSAVSSAAENRKTGCRNCGKTVRKDSEYSVGQINPVEVEGQTDVHGAEQVFTGPSAIPQYTNRPSLKMW